MPSLQRSPQSNQNESMVPAIVINPNRIALVLASLVFLFITLAVVGQLSVWVYGFDPESKFVLYFNVEAEKNPPALFAGLQLLFAATTAWVASKIDIVMWRRRYWQILAAGLAWMSFDEVFRMHERLIEPMRALLGGGDLGMFTYAWVVPAIFVVSIVGLLYTKFLLGLPSETGLWLFASGAVFVGGAVGLEMVGGWYWSQMGNTLTQSLIVITEEAMEFSGICLFIFVVLRFLQKEQANGLLKFSAL